MSVFVTGGSAQSTSKSNNECAFSSSCSFFEFVFASQTLRRCSTIDDQVFPARNRERTLDGSNFPEPLGIDSFLEFQELVRDYIYVSFEPLNVLENMCRTKSVKLKLYGLDFLRYILTDMRLFYSQIIDDHVFPVRNRENSRWGVTSLNLWGSKNLLQVIDMSESTSTSRTRSRTEPNLRLCVIPGTECGKEKYMIYSCNIVQATECIKEKYRKIVVPATDIKEKIHDILL
ncbi:hypothetical protein CEXT_774281 [Caerostris extrusa]|uniref:Maturase K n=1 Tax=Caerostris extrusa TaxID=172846 RepID=A0AAV4NIA0_CAEEX|nr:hypothetical protein CEXT_774281 [Caerostris extrusa]